MKKHDFTAVYKKRGHLYVAWVEEIPGVNTQGDTLKEAKENLREALRLVLDANRSISKRKSHLGVRREPISVLLPA